MQTLQGDIAAVNTATFEPHGLRLQQRPRKPMEVTCTSGAKSTQTMLLIRQQLSMSPVLDTDPKLVTMVHYMLSRELHLTGGDAYCSDSAVRILEEKFRTGKPAPRGATAQENDNLDAWKLFLDDAAIQLTEKVFPMAVPVVNYDGVKPLASEGGAPGESVSKPFGVDPTKPLTAARGIPCITFCPVTALVGTGHPDKPATWNCTHVASITEEEGGGVFLDVRLVALQDIAPGTPLNLAPFNELMLFGVLGATEEVQTEDARKKGTAIRTATSVALGRAGTKGWTGAPPPFTTSRWCMPGECVSILEAHRAEVSKAVHSLVMTREAYDSGLTLVRSFMPMVRALAVTKSGECRDWDKVTPLQFMDEAVGQLQRMRNAADKLRDWRVATERGAWPAEVQPYETAVVALVELVMAPLYLLLGIATRTGEDDTAGMYMATEARMHPRGFASLKAMCVDFGSGDSTPDASMWQHVTDATGALLV